MINPRFNELTVVLPVTNMKVSLEFYRKLGCEIAWTWPNDTTEVNQAGIRIGNTDRNAQFQITLQEKRIGSTGWIFINVSDIDTLYNHYQSIDIEIEQELDNFPWGYREFWIRDPDNNQIRFTQELHHDVGN